MQIKDELDVTTVRLNESFELLCPTMVFRPTRKAMVPQATAKPAFDPFALPTNQALCVHVETKLVGEVRCTRRADWFGSNGWLCREHTLRTSGSSKPFRNYDQEVVDGVIKVEKQALDGVEREVVKLDIKDPTKMIQFIKG